MSYSVPVIPGPSIKRKAPSSKADGSSSSAPNDLGKIRRAMLAALEVDVRHFERDDKSGEELLVFDLKGVDTSFANALRRIMISEVETVAIEVVEIHRNDSVLQDEILSHRLGLLPIRADPQLLEPWARGDTPVPWKNAAVFSLKYTAKKEDKHVDGSVHLTSNRLLLVPHVDWQDIDEHSASAYERPASAGKKSKKSAQQDEDDGNASDDSHDSTDSGSIAYARKRLPQDRPVVVHDDIMLAKLNPGESIQLRCYATRGKGAEHAKWSPVCTASYRLMPRIEIENGPMTGKEAEKIKALCPKDVFDIEDAGNLVVARPRDCTVCRECIRLQEPVSPDEENKPPRIALSREADWFVFSLETTGALPAIQVVRRAVEVLREKAKTTALAATDLLDAEDVAMGA